MTKRVMIQDNRVWEIVSQDAQFPAEVTVVYAPDDVEVGHGYIGGNFVKRSKFGTLPDQQDEAYKTQNHANAQAAKYELAVSDRVLIRYLEDGLPIDQAWKDHRVTLRSMVALEWNPTATPIPLPPRPPVPWPDVPVTG